MHTQAINLAIVYDLALFGKIPKNYLSKQTNFNVPVQTDDVLDLLDKLKTTSGSYYHNT